MRSSISLSMTGQVAIYVRAPEIDSAIRWAYMLLPLLLPPVMKMIFAIQLDLLLRLPYFIQSRYSERYCLPISPCLRSNNFLAIRIIKNPRTILLIRGCRFPSTVIPPLPLPRTGQNYVCSAGRSSDFRLSLLAAPSHPWRKVATAVFVPGYSGGPVADFHQPSLTPLRVTCVGCMRNTRMRSLSR